MSNTSTKRRTQAERRAESRQALLDSACRLFGERGYADTSLEEIAVDCGLTIRPIYHYFGNKKALFTAVNEIMEQRIMASMQIGNEGERGAGIVENWRAYLDLCDDPALRRIVLVDSPNILGRERWSSSAVSQKARAGLGKSKEGDRVKQYRAELLNAVVMGAFTEAALMIAEADDIDMAKREAERLMLALFSQLRSQLRGDRH
jgi:AcrR family transcriptional regulator